MPGESQLSGSGSNQYMATFILVHGAWHGGWCWRHVAPLLDRGRGVLAPDLRARGRSSGSGRPVAGRLLQRIEAWSGLRRDVVLVGHSLAGCGSAP
jgi:pimeloyl-ACP methyl ester carboxylesterase